MDDIWRYLMTRESDLLTRQAEIIDELTRVVAEITEVQALLKKQVPRQTVSVAASGLPNPRKQPWGIYKKTLVDIVSKKGRVGVTPKSLMDAMAEKGLPVDQRNMAARLSLLKKTGQVEKVGSRYVWTNGAHAAE